MSLCFVFSKNVIFFFNTNLLFKCKPKPQAQFNLITQYDVEQNHGKIANIEDYMFMHTHSCW